jgi:hypothetical protein
MYLVLVKTKYQVLLNRKEKETTTQESIVAFGYLKILGLSELDNYSRLISSRIRRQRNTNKTQDH